MQSQAQQTLGDKIRAARWRLGLSQQELAVELNAHVGVVQRWETDRNVPAFHYRRKLWEMLGLSPDDFPPSGPGSPGRPRRVQSKPAMVFPTSTSAPNVRAELDPLEFDLDDMSEGARTVLLVGVTVLALALAHYAKDRESKGEVEEALHAVRQQLDATTLEPSLLDTMRRFVDETEAQLAA